MPNNIKTVPISVIRISKFLKQSQISCGRIRSVFGSFPVFLSPRLLGAARRHSWMGGRVESFLATEWQSTSELSQRDQNSRRSGVLEITERGI